MSKKLRINKGLIIKIICLILVAALIFCLGAVWRTFKDFNTLSWLLANDIRELRDELLHINSLKGQPDFDFSQRDHESFFLQYYAGNTRGLWQAMMALDSGGPFVSDLLKRGEILFSPGAKYIRQIADEILTSNYEDYPELPEKYALFLEPNEALDRRDLLAYFESLEPELEKLSEKDWICAIGRFLTLGEISLFKKGNYLERF